MKTQNNRQAFLNYFNNYLSVERFAENNGLSLGEAQNIIDAGRIEHELHVEVIKTLEAQVILAESCEFWSTAQELKDLLLKLKGLN